MCLHCSTLSVHDDAVRRIKKLHHPIQGNRHHRGSHSGRIDLVEQHHRAIAVNLYPHFFEEVEVFAVIVGDLLQRHAHLLREALALAFGQSRPIQRGTVRPEKSVEPAETFRDGSHGARVHQDRYLVPGLDRRPRDIGHRTDLGIIFAVVVLWAQSAAAQQASTSRILIHMKTALAEDDAQICAVPNVAWAAVKAGHKITILVDASAVTSVTKGFGWFNGLFRPDSTALDRAALPERERQSLSQQMGVPLEQVPHDYGEYFDFLKKMGVEIYGNRTMMVLYQIEIGRAHV